MRRNDTRPRAARSIPLASKRGLGAHPAKIYGLFTPPTLTLQQLQLTGAAFTACLLLACTPLAPRVFCFLAYVLYFFYFPQARPAIGPGCRVINSDPLVHGRPLADERRGGGGSWGGPW